ncbi:hypothetical protein ACFVRD_36980 [Streptomyces sp. NPDC057908]|uniref:hypothetical protein n=1 Tax=Streptomyces sp. NPDC057908 TaxID=3346276 RepID=UPI0036EFFFB7
MTSTPRLDDLTATGTTYRTARIHLADGQGIALSVHRAAVTVDRIFVSPGVTVPETEAWGDEELQLDAWLTVGRLRQRSSYKNVPIEAVRDLIVRHGGEHADQGEAWSIPDAGTAADLEAEENLRFPGLLADLADLRGRFEDGYSADDIRAVFGRIHDEGGPYLVCVWGHADDCGFGGNSQFYAEEWDGGLFEVQPDIHRWLSGQQETPGPLSTWVGERAYEPGEFLVSDDFHNYARSDRPE